MFDKPAETAVTIIDPLARRWSGRAFDPGRGIAPTDQMALFEAARWAPSCYGDQPWRFMVWDRERHGETWPRALACLGEFNQGWARAAPLLVAALADTLFNHNDRPNRWGGYDTGAASMSLCVQAAAMGLMTHQMGGFDAGRLRAEFGIPDRLDPLAMIAIGYQLPEADIPADAREREYAPRQRRPIGETFRAGTWDQPFGT